MSRHSITTLILGAGASEPYGFPTGRQLIDRIEQGLTAEPKALYTQLHEGGYDHTLLAKFGERLRNLGAYSIDSFLQAHPNLRPIGCAAIAATLIPCEDIAKLRPADARDDWYRYLFNELRIADHFDMSWLRILTFNYDRSLEQHLFECLTKGMGCSGDQVRLKVSSPYLLHLHGQLGELPWWSSTPNEARREYCSACDPRMIAKCASGIRVMGDSAPAATSILEDAYEILQRSEVVCFIGFGYHQDCLELLRLKELCPNCRMFGTALGLPAHRRNELEQEIPGIVLGGFDERVVDFLQRTGTLRLRRDM